MIFFDKGVNEKRIAEVLHVGLIERKNRNSLTKKDYSFDLCLNGIDFLSGQDSIFSKYLTGTTPSKPSVKITLFSEM